MRQIHHWAALLFVAAIVLHLCRIFFTGAYRRPREINWVIGVTMLCSPSPTASPATRCPTTCCRAPGCASPTPWWCRCLSSAPTVASLVFGGEFPASDITSRLYVLHILIVPAVIARAAQRPPGDPVAPEAHPVRRTRAAPSTNVVGSRLWPTYAWRSLGLLCIVGAVLAVLGGLFQINPVWLYGPYEPYAVSTAAQPDWYMGWLEGALRLIPAFRLELFGYRVPELLLPAVIFPGVTFAALYLWPAIDKRLTGDRREHHLLDAAAAPAGTHGIRRRRAGVLRRAVRRRLAGLHRSAPRRLDRASHVDAARPAGGGARAQPRRWR